jgi:hypothetical protein
MLWEMFAIPLLAMGIGIDCRDARYGRGKKQVGDENEGPEKT